MAFKLKEFQEQAVDELLTAARNEEPSIVLKSCTGSGKTIILTRFASECMAQDRDAVTIWFTPGQGELELQSKEKMERYVHGCTTKTLDDVMTEGFAAGDACFINWERLNKKSNTAMRESERLNLIDHISTAQDAGIRFLVIIDEGHTNDTVKTKEIVGLFSPISVIRASATPTYEEKDVLVEVPEDEVIEQGLIKKGIVINEDVPHEAVVENEVDYLIDLANAKRMEAANAFRKLDADVNPLVVVQLPDADDRLRAMVEASLAKRGISYENGNAAVWLSEEHRNIDGVTENNAPQQFIIIKQAVAVGWDCPRAHILVKLRDNMSETFQIQTIGRIRRMPQARHYEMEVLDNCYIYTFDARFIDEAKAASGKHVHESRTLQLKAEYYYFSLTAEQRDADEMRFDPRAAYSAIRAHFVESIGLVSVAGNKALMQKAGYVFERRLRDKAQSGTVRHADASELNALDTIDIEVKASNRDLHDACNNQLYKIANSTGMGYSDLGKIFRRLFLKGSSDKKSGDVKLLSLEQPDYYAFVANNAELLKEAVRDAVSNNLPENQRLLAPTREKTFRLPQEVKFKYDASEKDQSLVDKNVYDGYRASACPRSDGEKRFEEFCQSSPRVKWFYKNGDKGSEYFSIVYLDNAGRDPLFFPDYILEDSEGTIWIIEAKGGQKKSGESENIDRFAGKKFDALQSYIGRHPGLKMGFVRYDQKSQRLCINTEQYTEDLDTFFWKLLKDVL